jgi:hypothetical protein
VFSICEGDLPAGYRYRIDCGKVGLNCDSSAGCVDRAPVACDSGTTPPSCNALGEGEFCDNGFIQHTPVCADLGLDCVAGECVGRGAACTNLDSGQPGDLWFEGVSCAGDTLEACVNGQLSNVDCTTRGPGFTCQTVGTTSFCGLAADCAPAGQYSHSESDPASCDGSTLTFCNAGRLEHIDCTALGFSGCEIDTSVGHYGCIPI